jgi:hypothetical protein
MKQLILFLAIPIFMSYGPNAVGYSTIIETTLSDNAIRETEDLMACNILSEYGDHRLIEGYLISKEPLQLMVNTPLFKYVPLSLEGADIDFCLVSKGH